MNINSFDWDEWNSTKCQKHGVKIHEIEEAFINAQFYEDKKHSENERRFFLINITAQNRSIFVVYTLRFTLKGLAARPISARFMHRKEIKKHEKANLK